MFKNKYLKYKSKYLSAKKLIGGVFNIDNQLQELDTPEALSQAFISLGNQIYIGFATQLNNIIELLIEGNERQQMWADFVLNQYNTLGAPPGGLITPAYLANINAIFTRARRIRERLPPHRMSTRNLNITDLRQFLYVRSPGLTRIQIDALDIDAIRQLILQNWANVFSD